MKEMTAVQAIEHMSSGGCVKTIAPNIDPINNRGYWKLYRNGVVLKLIQDTPCAAIVWVTVSVVDFVSSNHDRYEPYE